MRRAASRSILTSLPLLLVLLAAPGLPSAEEVTPAPPTADAIAPAPTAAPTGAARAPSKARWFDRVRDAWLQEHLPASWRSAGPKGLAGWQWASLPLFALFCLLAGRVGMVIGRLVLRPIARRTAWKGDDQLLERLSGPTALLFALITAWLMLPGLALTTTADALLRQGLRAFALIAFFWALFRTVDVVADLVRASPWARGRPAATGLIPLGTRSAKIALVPLTVVTVLAELGYPVASLLAGLGIGGLAIALAAQKTVENLFGSVSIGVDQPFRVGDFVRIEDATMGDVEEIGLRSTRIRTMGRTLVTFPNGKLADLKIETFAARDRIKLGATYGLSLRTSRAQLQVILQGFREVLRAHPKVWEETIQVNLASIAPSSLDVEVLAWFRTQEYGEFKVCREEVLLAFLRVVEEAGAAFAEPTRQVLLRDERRAE